MRNFAIRTLTAIAYVALLTGCTVYSPVTAFFFFAIAAAACVWEFCGLMNKYAGATLVPSLHALGAILLTGAVWLMCIGNEAAGKTIALYGFLLLYIVISELYRRAENPLRNWSLSILSQLYIALPFSLLPMLSIKFDSVEGRFSYTWMYPMALFVFLWLNDTGAYLFGVSLQRYFPKKLFPRVSPRKSWIGSIGGALLTLTAALLVWHFVPGTLTLWQWLGFAAVVILFGTWGDLVESLLKRHLGIKDSGNILPGHGGMLDRFDSALLAIPAVVIYFILI